MASDVNITYVDMSAPVENSSAAASTTNAPIIKAIKGTRAPKVAAKATEDTEMTDVAAPASVIKEAPPSAPVEDDDDLEVITHKKTGTTSINVSSSRVTSKCGKGLFDLPPVMTTGLRSGRLAKAPGNEVFLEATHRRAAEVFEGNFGSASIAHSSLEGSSRDLKAGSKHVQVGRQRSPICKDSPPHENLQSQGTLQPKEMVQSPSTPPQVQEEVCKKRKWNKLTPWDINPQYPMPKGSVVSTGENLLISEGMVLVKKPAM